MQSIFVRLNRKGKELTEGFLVQPPPAARPNDQWHRLVA